MNKKTRTIAGKDITKSVADALQYISYCHPLDYIRYLSQAYAREQSPAAKNAIGQILLNSRMTAPDLPGHRSCGGLCKGRHGRPHPVNV